MHNNENDAHIAEILLKRALACKDDGARKHELVRLFYLYCGGMMCVLPQQELPAFRLETAVALARQREIALFIHGQKKRVRQQYGRSLHLLGQNEVLWALYQGCMSAGFTDEAIDLITV